MKNKMNQKIINYFYLKKKTKIYKYNQYQIDWQNLFKNMHKLQKNLKIIKLNMKKKRKKKN